MHVPLLCVCLFLFGAMAEKYCDLCGPWLSRHLKLWLLSKMSVLQSCCDGGSDNDASAPTLDYLTRYMLFLCTAICCTVCASHWISLSLSHSLTQSLTPHLV